MAVYLLNCDADEARACWVGWFTERRPWKLRLFGVELPLAWPRVIIDPSDLAGARLSIEVRPRRAVRFLALVVLLSAITSWFIFNRWLQSGAIVKADLDAVSFSLAGIAINLLGSALFFAPLFALSAFNAGLCRPEAAFIHSLNSRGIDAHQLTPRRQWVLFPGDAVLIEATALLALMSLFVVLSRRGSLFWPFAPWILMIVSYTCLATVSELAQRAMLRSYNPYDYWRFRASQLANTVAGPFLLVLLCYSGLYYGLHSTLAIRYSYTQGSVPSGPATTPDKALRHQLAVFDFDSASFIRKLDSNGLRTNTQVAVDYVEVQTPNSRYVGLVMGLTYGVVEFLVLLFSYRAVRAWQNEWNGYPHRSAVAPISAHGSQAPPILIWSHWLLLLAGNLAAVGIIGAVICWTLNLNLVPLTWTAPFVWYEIALGSVLGAGGGAVIARASLIMLIAPAVLWLTLWLVQLVKSATGLLTQVRSPNNVSPRVATAIAYLSAKSDMSQPRVIETQSGVSWPQAGAGIPFLGRGVLRVSTPIVDALNDDQLVHVLAHELGHIQLHLGRMALLQTVSNLSLSGPGYLTLLSDYWGMEVEADGFAVHLTEDVGAYTQTLSMVPTLEANARAAAFDSGIAAGAGAGYAPTAPVLGQATRSRWSDLIEPYRLYFGSSMWGYFHPSIETRIAQLDQTTILGPDPEREVVRPKDGEASKPTGGHAPIDPPPAATGSNAGSRSYGMAESGFTAVRDRLLAYSVDLLFLFLVIMAVTGVNLSTGAERGSSREMIHGYFAMIWPFVYFTICWRLWGRTLGYRLLGLRVCRHDLPTLSVWRALLRSIALILELATVVGLFLPIFDAGRRRELADWIAGTLVRKRMPPPASEVPPLARHASRILRRVQKQARRAGGEITTSAFLTALVRSSCTASRVLAASGGTSAMNNNQPSRHVRTGGRTAPSLSPSLARALADAKERANRRGSARTDCIDILASLIQQADASTSLISEAGLDQERLHTLADALA